MLKIPPLTVTAALSAALLLFSADAGSAAGATGSAAGAAGATVGVPAGTATEIQPDRNTTAPDPNRKAPIGPPVRIPTTFEPGAILTYGARLEPIITYDTSAAEHADPAPVPQSAQETPDLEGRGAEDEFFREVAESVEDLPVTDLGYDLPAPVPGTVVMYGTDGHINHIYADDTLDRSLWNSVQALFDSGYRKRLAFLTELYPDPAARPVTRPLAVTADYITMSYSEYATADEEGPITTRILSYDTAAKQISKVFEFEYTSQYPLGFYDKANQTVYYTQRVGTDRDYGDQIFAHNLSGGPDTQLTERLFAVNYLIPSGDQLFFVANVKGEKGIRLGAIDLDTKAMTLWGDDDMIVEAIAVDHRNRRIYASVYSVKAKEYSLSHQGGPPGSNHFKMPPYTVYETDFNLQGATRLFSNDYWIRMLMYTEGHLVALCDREYNKSQVPSTVVDYDTVSRTSSVSRWKTARLQRGEANYSSDGGKIYTLAIVDNVRGLYEYDIASDQFTPIFTPQEGFINNIQVVRTSVPGPASTEAAAPSAHDS